MKLWKVIFKWRHDTKQASSSCREEENDDVAGSTEPGKSTQNVTFHRSFPILAPFQISSHKNFMISKTKHDKESVEENLR